MSVPPESLQRNELRKALNVEFSPLSGVLRVRGGLCWSGRFVVKVQSVVNVAGTNGFLVNGVNSDKLYFFKWNNSAVTWNETGVMLIATGGKLQKFNGNVLPPTLETIDNAPDNCRFVFVREGRAVVVGDDDTIRFSAVGDCTSWANDSDDDSSGQFLEIGYKDGMNIDAVVPLSRDLIIFKRPQF